MEYKISSDYDGKPRRVYASACIVCTKVTWVPRHVLGRRKTCSLTCRGRARERRQDLTCAFCHVTFTRAVCRKSDRGLNFCTRSCKDKAQRIGGLDALRLPHYKTGAALYRHRALRDHGAVCVRCSYNADERMLDVHHVDSDRNNGLPSNLEVLCVWCHALHTRHVDPHDWIGEVRDRTPASPRPENPVQHCKARYPDDDVLRQLVWTKPIRLVAIDFGVSYNAVKTRCLRRGIPTPPRGYWNTLERRQV